MVKRTPPLAVAVIGTGDTPTKNVEALLNDYTSPYAEVTFVLPVDDDHWSPVMESVHAWIVANEIPYVAVTDGSSPSKALVSVLEAADSTQKVARVSTKLVQLLAGEAQEGADVTLLVAWDDDDQEAATAVTKALSSSVKALNLCDGLDEFEFDDEDGDDEPQEVAHTRKPAAEDETTQPTDEYDDFGIRKLRAMLREREGHRLNDRQIGQLEKADAVKILRSLDAGQPAEEEDEEPVKETSTTKARRAFAEGAAEGSGDEAQTLPRSRGGDILEDEDDDTIVGAEIVDKGITQAAPLGTDYEESMLRHRALELAVQAGAGPDGVLALAAKMETYLRGQRQSPGRPRADGTPAQPREIGPDGKPVRRRPTRPDEGSTD